MATKPKSRVSKKNSTQLTQFKFRWWMGLILVLVVAVIGIVVFRYSHAGAGNSEGELDSYFVYQRGYSARVANDGTFLYKTYTSPGGGKACYFAAATQQAADSWNAFFSPSYKSNGSGSPTIIVGRWYPSKKCI